MSKRERGGSQSCQPDKEAVGSLASLSYQHHNFVAEVAEGGRRDVRRDYALVVREFRESVDVRLSLRESRSQPQIAIDSLQGLLPNGI